MRIGSFLRQFRLTGDNYGNIFKKKSVFCISVKIRQTTITLKTDENQFDYILKGFMCSKLSTNSTKRGSVNETAVMDYLRANYIFIGLFEMGLVSMKEVPYIAP